MADDVTKLSDDQLLSLVAQDPAYRDQLGVKVNIPGKPEGNISVRQNNATNLIYANQPGAEKGARDFGSYKTPESGYYAARHQVDLFKGRGYTLAQGAERWFRNPKTTQAEVDAYVKDISKLTGLSPNTPLKDVDTDLFTAALSKRESGADVQVGGKSVLQKAAEAVGWPASAEAGFFSSTPKPAEQMTDAELAASLGISHNPMMIMPVNGKLGGQNEGGWSDSRGENRIHHAGDIYASAGDPVYSPVNGIVSAPFPGRGMAQNNMKVGDWGVDIYDPSTKQTYKMVHMGDTSNLKPGQEVKAGQQIGVVGNVVSNPHLHLQVLDEKGQPVNWMQRVGAKTGSQFAANQPFDPDPRAGKDPNDPKNMNDIQLLNHLGVDPNSQEYLDAINRNHFAGTLNLGDVQWEKIDETKFAPGGHLSMLRGRGYFGWTGIIPSTEKARQMLVAGEQQWASAKSHMNRWTAGLVRGVQELAPLLGRAQFYGEGELPDADMAGYTEKVKDIFQPSINWLLDWADKFEKEAPRYSMPPGWLEKTAAGLISFPMEFARYTGSLALTGMNPIAGFALAEGLPAFGQNKNWNDIIMAVNEGMVMGGIFAGAHPLSPLAKSQVIGATFAINAWAQGGDKADVLSSYLTGMALGISGEGGNVKARDAISDAYRYYRGIKPEQKVEAEKVATMANDEAHSAFVEGLRQPSVQPTPPTVEDLARDIEPQKGQVSTAEATPPAVYPGDFSVGFVPEHEKAGFVGPPPPPDSPEIRQLRPWYALDQALPTMEAEIPPGDPFYGKPGYHLEQRFLNQVAEAEEMGVSPLGGHLYSGIPIDPDYLKRKVPLWASRTATFFQNMKGFESSSGQKYANLFKQWLSGKGPTVAVPGVTDKVRPNPEEIKWSGLIPYLESRAKDGLTKQEVVDYINTHKIGVVDRWRGRGKLSDAQKARYEELKAKMADGTMSNEEWREHTDLEKIDMGLPTKFFSQLEMPPGGEDSREVLLMWPIEEQEATAGFEYLRTKPGLDVIKKGDPIPYWLKDTQGKSLIDWDSVGGPAEYAIVKYEDAVDERGKPTKTATDIRYTNNVGLGSEAKAQGMEPVQNFKTWWAHAYGDPAFDLNRFANILLQDRVINGKKYLWIAEMQSDWKIARDKAAQMQAEREGLTGEKAKARARELAKSDKITLGSGTTEDPHVAPFPFYDNWHQVGIKRLFEYAASNGYDGISWTNPDMVRERYDMTRLGISKFRYNDAEKRVQAFNRFGQMINDARLELDDPDRVATLEHYATKDVADLLRSKNPDADGWTEVTGNEVRSAGKWADDVYGKAIPTFVRDYARQWGPVDLERGTVPSLFDWEDLKIEQNENGFWVVDPSKSRREAEQIRDHKYVAFRGNTREEAQAFIDKQQAKENKEPTSLISFSPETIQSLLNNPQFLHSGIPLNEISRLARKVAELFKNKMTEVVDQKTKGTKQNKATEWVNLLNNWSKSGAFKAEDLKFSYAIPWLEGQGDKVVTREELLKFLDDHGYKFEDIIKGGHADPILVQAEATAREEMNKARRREDDLANQYRNLQDTLKDDLYEKSDGDIYNPMSMLRRATWPGDVEYDNARQRVLQYISEDDLNKLEQLRTDYREAEELRCDAVATHDEAQNAVEAARGRTKFLSYTVSKKEKPGFAEGYTEWVAKLIRPKHPDLERAEENLERLKQDPKLVEMKAASEEADREANRLENDYYNNNQGTSGSRRLAGVAVNEAYRKRNKLYEDYERYKNELLGAAQRTVNALKEPEYHHGHFDVPDYLFHMRFMDRFDKEGRRILFIEEIQSDWHDDGRKNGYYDPEVRNQINELEQQYRSLRDGPEYRKLIDKADKLENKARRIRYEIDEKQWYDSSWDDPVVKEKLRKAEEAAEKAQQKVDQYRRDHIDPLGEQINALRDKDSSTPPAPFAKDWFRLAMLKLFRHAAEHGYDGVGWTTGDTQWRRWGSSRIDWKAEPRYVVYRNGERVYDSRSIERAEDWARRAKEVAQQDEGFKPPTIEVREEPGFRVAVENQASAHMDEADNLRIREQQLEYDGIFITDVNQLIDRVANNTNRGRAYAEKTAHKIWEKMQAEPEGTLLPRKEGMNAFYDDAGRGQDLVHVAKKFIKQFGVNMEEGATLPGEPVPPEKEYKIRQLDNGRWEIYNEERGGVYTRDDLGEAEALRDRLMRQMEFAPEVPLHLFYLNKAMKDHTLFNSFHFHSGLPLQSLPEWFMNVWDTLAGRRPGPGRTDAEFQYARTKSFDESRRMFAPETRGLQAFRTAVEYTKWNTLARAELLRAAKVLQGYRSKWLDLPYEERWKLSSKMERGEDVPDEWKGYAAARKAVFDKTYEIINSMRDKGMGFREFYAPHLFKNPDEAKVFFDSIGRMPIEGRKGFLKAGINPDMNTAMEKGLIPLFDDPVAQDMAGLMEQWKYIAANDFIKSLEKNNLFIPVDKVDPIHGTPAGWVKTDPRVFKAGYAPQHVMDIINNHLVSDAHSLWFNKYKNLTAAWNAWHVTFSAFHGVNTLMNEMAMGFAQGIPEFLGSVITGDYAGAIKAAKRIGPMGVVDTFKIAKKGFEAFYDPGKHGPHIDNLVRIATEGGLLPEHTMLLSGDAAESFKEMGQQFTNREMGKAFRSLTHLLGKPIMGWLVPRVKYGSTLLRIERELKGLNERYAAAYGDNWNPEVQAKYSRELGEIAYNERQFSENIFGEIHPDNLHWNRAMSSWLKGIIAYPGWNVGTARWITGMARGISELAVGRPVDYQARLSLQFGAGLVLAVGLANTLLHMALNNGETPQDWKDVLIGARTGATLNNGLPERVTVASYMKDLIAFNVHPGQTIMSKLQAPFSIFTELYNNADYFGTEIIPSKGGIGEKALGLGKYVGEKALPFGFTGVKTGKSAVTQYGGFAGLRTVPRYLTNTTAMNRIDTILRETSPKIRHAEQAEESKLMADIKDLGWNGKEDEMEEALGKALDEGKISRVQAKHIRQDVMKDRREVQFRKVHNLEDAIEVYQLATPEERALWQSELTKKWRHASPEKKRKLAEAFDEAMTLPVEGQEEETPIPKGVERFSILEK